LRPRQVPDVPEDVDFLMEHLNDPNYDLNASRRRSGDSFELDDKKADRFSVDYLGHGSEYDRQSHLESDRYSASRAESRNSTALEFDDESPYPEVRAAVSSIDDPTMPVNTFRMWFMGILFTLLVSGLNQVFSLRYPSIYISGIVAQLVALPVGKGLERVLPARRFRTFGYVWSLNPGPFNIKEHVCVTVMANVVVNGAYATDVIATQRFFFHQSLSFTYSMMLVLSTQMIGFSLGGLLRQFVVWPSSMIWPGALVNAALFNTLHNNYGKLESRHISREKFFCIAMACSCVWYWVPGYLFTALSVFNWACWIAPNNIVVNQLFGTLSGLGMGIFTFDWSMIAYFGSPLVTPWWSEVNTASSLVLFLWILVPIIYYTNSFNSKWLPISGSTIFDNTGSPYDPTAVLTDGTFDVEKYRAYSPLFLPAARVMSYGVAFAALTAALVHTLLWYRRDIVRRFRSSLKDERDVHSRLMQAYPEVPGWWYALIGIPTMIMLLVSIEIYPTQLPIWGACLAFFIAAVLSIPLAMIQAIANQQVTLQVMEELLAGYMLPGRPVANMIFKTVALIGTTQGMQFAGDLKLGHYMKVPPRMMFLVQAVAAFVSCFTVVAIQDWMFANITDLCSETQKNGFICPSTRTFASAAMIWGGVGPSRIFGSDAYGPLLYFLLVGAVLPVPFYFLARRYPLSFWRYINIPVFFAGIQGMPPATGINYASWVGTGFVFNFLIRRYHFRWWMRYNYILSAALDAGVALAIILVFFSVQYPKGGFTLNWWGNTVWMNTADGTGLGPTLYTLQPGETFGPTTWS
jgi:OPT family small oligopeptide transporter